ncbi:hypothetical protein KBW71_00770 [Hydrogenophaga aromaticivorans]|uniref:hypothetical protein n=1 Tax=Hydrogenophaga aromaticivorans TaxID=2610898 RepID=UPI001B39858D|nr:hypothetical protein [Hydrogenophaga aromaticivorans]MBQ0916984.1 hypothetical protein [Hydrogenophaga aromaticivorans]
MSTAAPMAPTRWRPPFMDAGQRDDWVDHLARGHQHPAFVPTERHLPIVEAVQHAQSLGHFYTDAIAEAAAQYLGLDVPALPPESAGAFNMDAYYAAQALASRSTFKKTEEAALGFRLRPGDAVGAIIGNDLKLVQGITLVSVDETGMHYQLKGRRGSTAVVISMSALALKVAVDAAHAKGRRRDSFHDFALSRAHLPLVKVTADPRESQRKTHEQLKLDSADAKQLVDRYHALSREAGTRMKLGEPGSADLLIAVRDLAVATLCQVRAAALCCAFTSGDDVQEHVHRVDAATERLSAAIKALSDAFPQGAVATPIEALQARRTAAVEAAKPPSLFSTLVNENRATALRLHNVMATHICDAQEKRLASEIARGHETDESARERLLQERTFWAEKEPDDRICGLAQAIVSRDPSRLLDAWAVEGHGTSGTEGSIKGFQQLTGIRLLGLSSEKRAEAIYDWAGWSPEQVQADKRARQQAKADRRAEIEAKNQQEHSQSVTRVAAQSQIQNAETGQSMSIKDYVDGLVANGFCAIRKHKVGAATRTYLANPETGTGYLMPNRSLSEYAEVAVQALASSDQHAPAEAPTATESPA